jgi:hypothetical protein
MNKLAWILAASAAALMIVDAQQGPDIKAVVSKAGQIPRIAVPDLRGTGRRKA